MRVIERTMFYGASPNTFDIIEEILKTIAVLKPPLGGRG
jgi:hypothetical protein